MKKFTILSALPLIAACSHSPEQRLRSIPPPPMPPERVEAALFQGDKNVGNVRLTENANGAEMAILVRGLAVGEYGIHLHETGQCTGPDYMSAGAHWNPMMRQHGIDNPQGTHAGDLPNLKVTDAGGGVAEFYQQLDGIKLTGDKGLLDADGAAVIIHAKPDDNKTDPSGNSGARLICGVIKRF
jgi:superoxide dismutase, Cu-Zn family